MTDLHDDYVSVSLDVLKIANREQYYGYIRRVYLYRCDVCGKLIAIVTTSKKQHLLGECRHAANHIQLIGHGIDLFTFGPDLFIRLLGLADAYRVSPVDGEETTIRRLEFAKYLVEKGVLNEWRINSICGS